MSFWGFLTAILFGWLYTDWKRKLVPMVLKSFISIREYILSMLQLLLMQKYSAGRQEAP